MDRSFTKYGQERFCFLRRADSLFATGGAERDKGWHRQAGRRFECAAKLYRRALLSLMARKSRSESTSRRRAPCLELSGHFGSSRKSWRQAMGRRWTRSSIWTVRRIDRKCTISRTRRSRRSRRTTGLKRGSCWPGRGRQKICRGSAIGPWFTPPAKDSMGTAGMKLPRSHPTYAKALGGMAINVHICHMNAEPTCPPHGRNATVQGSRRNLASCSPPEGGGEIRWASNTRWGDAPYKKGFRTESLKTNGFTKTVGNATAPCHLRNVRLWLPRARSLPRHLSGKRGFRSGRQRKRFAGSSRKKPLKLRPLHQ